MSKSIETDPARTVRGAVIRRGDTGYEEARLAAVWNERKPDRFPAVIVIAEDEQDVVRAVRLARSEGLRVSIRSGGHSWVGNGVRDGGMLIDLSRLQEITVDPEARTAAVQPAAKGPAIQGALAPHGLFFPTGHAPTVGIGGFILGGGYGWNSRHLGPACLSIRAIDVVLADGTLVHATDETHPDLLWAARGSGPGFFGVVTRFHLRVHERPAKIVRTVHSYPLALRDEVLAWSYDLLEQLPTTVEFSAKVGFTPDLGVPTVSLTATAFCTSEHGPEALALLETAPFRDRAVRSTVRQETTIEELYDIADRLTPEGLRWSVDGVWADGTAEEILAAATPVFDTIPSGNSFVLWMLWGHYPPRPDACWSIQAKAYVSPNAGWNDPAEDLRHETWAHGSLAAMQHMSKGLQFSDNNVADRFDLGISVENAERLEQIRAAYDPEGLFRTYMSPAESTTALAAANRA
ncbi:FAD-binding oxidoreductase [Actinomadura madurae]|uniref:FAD-binding oxidoreductase n=1 Tax=Actinomadura madurae TaxID=1993 RepID=UPI0020D216A9|nr:FAD-binding oxidoreductase [Actinomadura madurae]MCP9955586.1 FAD-binding oxidoreductase [Actinomadura madurae]MCP9972324.1 FAD-binding oxidoreductase [Actinomadura madurae]MCP9984831.1 FAD-binding oxidoreductase [Actinomadura madurae]MCQ0003618.1 FAD-binding oxidoreductase [Actinomadura madurae]MCQ0021019.1 FAD-binding oxidoreductase [Actinomadura madurae]